MATGVYIRTKKHIENMSKAAKKALSNPETRKKMSLSHIGKKHTKEQIEKMRESHRKNGGIKYYEASEETRNKMRLAKLGKEGYWKNKIRAPVSDQTKRKLSIALSGSKSSFWKGGVTTKNSLIRSGLDYKLWRRAVFERDDYTCQICSKRGIKLQADHIKQFAHFPELRFELSNGRTLCVPCHKETDTYLWKGTKIKK